jgi:hypothetical protein
MLPQNEIIRRRHIVVTNLLFFAQSALNLPLILCHFLSLLELLSARVSLEKECRIRIAETVSRADKKTRPENREKT